MKLQKKLTNQEQVKRSGYALKFQLINKCLFSLATKESLADPCPSSFSILKTKLSIFTTYIPQGSPLSPILFLLCISGLLGQLQDPEKGTLGFGFVDDTYLVTWGASAAQNCHRLNTAHSQCQRWAEAHGAKFAPDQYQLMHFTRSKRHAREDLASTVRIGNHRVEVEGKAIKVLGVWLDPGLTWKEHITQANRKGIAASEALARLATSTWGPSTRNTRLLYPR